MGAIGAFTFVLHSHLPYARLAGRWPHGEEWIHEAASETYIPLLQTLYDLKEEGIDFKLTVGITPILAEQLADADVLDHFDAYLDEKIEAAERDMEYFAGKPIDVPQEVSEEATTDEGEPVSPYYEDMEQPSTEDEHLRYLAEWYRDWYTDIKDLFNNRFQPRHHRLLQTTPR